MKLIESTIVPYEGIGEIKLYSVLSKVKQYLDDNNIKFTSEIWKAEEETIPNPWTVLKIDNSIILYFAANDKLFKIYCTNDFKGSLTNGINLNTSIDDAKKIDNTLEYNDDGEDYESNNGYWVEDDLDNGKVLSITVFIKEILDDNEFDKLEW